MTSVNTNYGAMVALQQLNSTNSQLETTQSRINTGMKMAGAKDNGAVYAIAQTMRSDVASYEGVPTIPRPFGFHCRHRSCSW